MAVGGAVHIRHALRMSAALSVGREHGGLTRAVCGSGWYCAYTSHVENGCSSLR